MNWSGKPLVEIIGESDRQSALKQLDALFVAIEKSDRHFIATLFAEPEGLHHVRVEIFGFSRIGELSFQTTRQYHHLLAGRPYGSVTCPARLDGGGGKPYSVAIDVEAALSAVGQ